MKITLKHVAKEAGVSVTTASLVLSGKGRISEPVRKSVLEAAESLGYRRRSGGRTASRAPSVAILVSIDADWAMVWWFIRPIIDEIRRYFAARELLTVIIPIAADMSDDDIVQRIVAESCDGVFSLHYGSGYLLDTIEARGVPIIVIMNGRFQERYHCVLADDFQGAYEGTRHLVRLGHTRILFVDTERAYLPMLSNDRFYGFMKALDEAGIEFAPEMRINCDVHNSAYFEANIHAAFSVADPPTAVFAIDDDVAVRVIKFIGDRGLNVPDDVSVIAPGDLQNYNDPHVVPITTLKINTQMMGQIACDMMSRLMEPIDATRSNGEVDSDIHVLKVKQRLVERGSTRPMVTVRPTTPGPSGSGHRARFLSAFSAQERCSGIPRWLGATREFLEQACTELGTTVEGFRDRIGDDLRWLDPDPVGQSIERRGAFGIDRRGFGYGQPVSHPLKASTTNKALSEYPWPEPEALDTTWLVQRIEELGGEHAIAGGPWAPFWHDAIDMVSLETLACLMYDDPVFVETLLARITGYYLDVSTRVFEQIGDRIDLFFIRNDFGSQTGPLISLDHFRRFLVPCLERFTKLGHRYGIKVMLHSSGGILPLIPSIISAGFDAIHALQPDCPGMQSNRLKRSFGGSIVLSGAIDARHILLTGTPDEVRDAVRMKVREMSEGGGYIAAPSTDAITQDVPVENVLAMYEAIDEIE